MMFDPDETHFLRVPRAVAVSTHGSDLPAIVAHEVIDTFAWYFDKGPDSIPLDAKLNGVDSRVMYGLIDRVAQRLGVSAAVDGAVQNRYRAGKVPTIKDLIDAFIVLIQGELMRGAWLALASILALRSPASGQTEAPTTAAESRPPELKVLTMSFGRRFGPDSTAVAATFAVDQPEAPNAGSPLELATFKCLGGFCHVVPSSQVSLGNGTKSAANNLAVQVPIDTWRSIQKRLWGHIMLTPLAFTADRAFDTSILYASLGGDLYLDRTSYLGQMPTFRWSARLGGRADLGERMNKGATPDATLYRFVPSSEVTLNWTQYLKLTVSGKVFIIQSDPFVGGNNTFGLASGSLDLRFRAPGPVYSDGLPRLLPIGVSLKYTRGHDEPKYEEQNALTVGLALYTRLR
jgi:hypothetical protein